MMFDVITISDDEEEVQFLDHIVNIEKPPVVDLTTTRSKKRSGSDSPPHPPPPPPPPPRVPPFDLRGFHIDQQSQSQPQPQPQPPPGPPQYPTSQQATNDAPLHPQPGPNLSSHSEKQKCDNPPQPFQRPQPTPKERLVHDAPPRQPSNNLASEQPKIYTPPQPSPPAQPPTPAQHPKPSPQTLSNNSRNQSECATLPSPSDHDLMTAKKEMGNKHFRRNSFNEAIRYYREASELAKKLNNQDMSAILHFNLAMSYDKLGAYNQAADECAAAVKLNDNYIKAHVKRAEIYMSQGKYEEAVICYEHVCEIDSTKRDDAMRRINLAKELFTKSKKRDHHEILGLSPHFTLDDLRASYKQKARAHHPDKHSDADVVTRRIHEKIFKEASEAYSFFRRRFA